MEIYQKNTQISITIKGNGEEIFDFDLPHPKRYIRNDSLYRLEYTLNGYFDTLLSISYLNDVLARFVLSMAVIDIKTKRIPQTEKGIKLKLFRGLKSIARQKDYEKVDVGQDNLFWAIKLYTEDLIRESTTGVVAYSLIESFAFARFEDRAKDKSTLKAKCRSIWNWYDARGWTIPQRKGLGMSRQEGARKVAQMNAEKTKAKVVGAIQSLEFLQEKINIATVSRYAKVSRDTAKKYLLEIGKL